MSCPKKWADARQQRDTLEISTKVQNKYKIKTK